MPHLQAGNDAADGGSVVSVDKTPRRVSETLPIMAATKKQSMEIKGDSYDSDDAVQTSSSASSSKQEVITPSPSGASAAPNSPKPTKGPFLSIYGSTRLFSSPIRVNNKKRTLAATDESTDGSADEESSASSQEEEVKTSPSTAQSPSFEKTNKPEKTLEDDSSVPSTKKARIESSPEPTTTKSQDQGSVRKPIISPTSSNENKEDDESTSQFSHGSAQPYYGRQAFQHRYPHQYPPPPHHSPYAPHHHPYGGHGAGYHQYPPPVGYNMYAAPGMYPPRHPQAPQVGHHYGAPPPNMYYPGPPPPQYHHHHPHYPPRHLMMSPVRVAQREFPMRRAESVPVSDASASQASSKSSLAPSPSPSTESSKEAAAMMANNDARPPNTKRCIALKEPLPAKHWGPSDTTKDIKLPEFHRIVNYPDYLSKTRGANAESPCSTADGKKHCVMCGEQRYCSASSLSKGRINSGKNNNNNKDETSSTTSATETDHIIPRQNKGLCTACDVTVWVMTDSGLEIKWCKGCKNYRPWAAFGEKGSATKCTKCRERQKEKYALSKDAATSKQQQQQQQEKQQQQKWETTVEEKHLEAANGLRSLIHAVAKQ
ncbi:unnamed protein product [Cylindrotheca closterium]|uniref:Uncharacterized protein n=1 Tax=Cylindrotheca closterium TaxID=2856 RepID=A0AAD2CWX0_9STRA|nr:unnamed protein product [Cylindrotheca closterium]